MFKSVHRAKSLLFTPLVLLPHLLLLAGREVVLDVEGLADLLGGLAFDHVGDGLAGHVQQALDVQVVGGQDQFEQGTLVHLEEVGVPARDVVGPLLLVLVVFGWRRVVLVVGGPLNHLLQDHRVDVGQRHEFLLILVDAQILQHGLDGNGAFGYVHIHFADLAIGALKLDLLHLEI